jgi:hypothetical protein
MSDGFHVSPPALVDLGGTFAGQQQSFHGLCGPAQQRAAAVDTGDAALDAETKVLIDMVSTMFRQAGDGLAETGTILTEIAAEYVASDQRGVGDIKPLAEELGENVDVPAV